MTSQHFCLRSCLEIDFRKCPVCSEPLKVFTYADGRVKIFTQEGRTPDRSCCKELQRGANPSVFERIRTKALHTRTRGDTWEFVPGIEEAGFTLVHAFRRHCCYYARLDDLERNTGHIRLYKKVVK